MEESRTTFQKGELMKKVLLAVGLGLALGAVITMPGLVLAFKPFLKGRRVSQQSLWKTYKTLARKKFVRIREVKGNIILEVTEEGKMWQKEYQLQDSIRELKISIPKTWDKKWRLLVFDIPEQKKRAREALRDLLEHLGFYRLQDSVFIYPFPCENEVDFLTSIFEVQKYVYCFTIENTKVPSDVAYHFSKLLARYFS
ncbi:MAG: CRISPR-associated endonuclease Cas2 [Candidatus Wildermuthbacteria bacterium]|nr:CRISPR-associated endonuclease Cas2 [Candidatus Wildermuthbacteria bacterium]